MTADLLVQNAVVVTVDDEMIIHSPGFAAIENGVFVAVDRHRPDQPLPRAAETLDAGGKILMPGLVNAHTHLPMSLFRGLADDLPLMEWLNNHIFPAEAAHINEQTAYWGSLLSIAEMFLSGTTCCCDGYFIEDAVAAAVMAAGLRAVLGHGVIDFPAPGVPDPAKNITAALEFTDLWRSAHPRITPSVFCHSPYTCGEKTLIRAKAETEDRGILLQIHAAETKNEREESLKTHGAPPIERLDGLGLLNERTLIGHGIWVDEKERALLARRKTGVVVTPESEMKLASGIPPVPAYHAAGVGVGLGTDGCASNNDLDMFGEMDTAAKLFKVDALDPTVAPAGAVLRAATREAAAVIGLGEVTGAVAVGKQADFLLLDTEAPHLKPLYNPVSQIVYAARGSDVTDVFIAGEPVVRDRRLTTIDLAEVFAEVEAVSRVIRK